MNPPAVDSMTSGTSRRRRVVPRLLAGAIVVAVMVLSTVSIAVAATTSFSDVPLSHPQRPAITALASWGIISGFCDGTFGPDKPVTRQQFAKMIVLTTDYPVSEGDICPFTDVIVSGPNSLYPDNYIAAGAAMRIIMGKTPTQFDPTGYITRHQVVTMAVRLVDSAEPGLLVAPAAGWVGNAAWASSPIHGANAVRAEYNGLLDGLDLDTLDPSGSMTRAEVARVLYNLLGGSAPEAPSGTLLYSDDFSDSASGWGDYREEPLEFGGAGYANGAYFIECPADSSWISLAPYRYGAGGVRDGRIEADLTLVSGVAQQNACGLVLRYQDDGSCYILELAGDGSYAFWRLEGDDLTDLVGWTTSSAIRPLGQTNHVEVALSGGSFTIRVNGTFLFTTTDTRLSSGAVGVFVDCISAGSAEAQFDNFKIWSQ